MKEETLSCPDGFQRGEDAYQKGDYATAFHEWRLLAKDGLAAAQYNLGVMYDEGQGVPEDDKTAVKWYTLAAEQGNAFAQYNLGQMHRDGVGVSKNYETAAQWFRLAAEQGSANA